MGKNSNRTFRFLLSSKRVVQAIEITFNDKSMPASKPSQKKTMVCQMVKLPSWSVVLVCLFLNVWLVTCQAKSMILLEVDPPQQEFVEYDFQPVDSVEEDSEHKLTTLDVFREMAHVDQEHDCLKRLVCEIGAEPAVYGDFGFHVSRLFNRLEANDAAAHQFQSSYHFGVVCGFRKACTKKYSSCTATPQQLLENALRY